MELTLMVVGFTVGGVVCLSILEQIMNFFKENATYGLTLLALIIVFYVVAPYWQPAGLVWNGLTQDLPQFLADVLEVVYHQFLALAGY